MNLNTKTHRRWFGAVCLFIAIAMLVVESTVLKGRIVGLVALGYWLACFVVTIFAVCVALLDLRAVRTETRAEQRALFESTLQQIAEEKSHRQNPDPKLKSKPSES